MGLTQTLRPPPSFLLDLRTQTHSITHTHNQGTKKATLERVLVLKCYNILYFTFYKDAKKIML